MASSPYAQQRDARLQNVSAILRDLWDHAPLSRATLAERNGLTKATVSAIVAQLDELGLVTDAGQDRRRPGRPGNLIDLDPGSRTAIGVEIATNYVAAVVTDLRGTELWRQTSDVDAVTYPDATAPSAEALIGRAIAAARKRAVPILGIGVGVPGAVDPEMTTVMSAPSLGWSEWPVRAKWEAKFGLRVVVENKARASAMAETLVGAAKGPRSRHLLYVNLGTDVGASIDSAVLIDGVPYRGSGGSGMDAGHLVIDPDGPACSCGATGCWQAMADVGREPELARALLADGRPSRLRDLPGGLDALEHRAIHAAAVEGDAVARQVLEEIVRAQALGVANLITILDPDLVVVGWASASLPEAFLERMARIAAIPEFNLIGRVAALLERRGAAVPEIRDASCGQDACLIGAAALLIDDLLTSPPAYGE